jgi:small-conductance mechanosensitive channel
MSVLQTIENTPLAAWVRESTDIYAYTLILAVHAVGLAIVVGFSTAVALRLLGFAKGIPLAAMRGIFPIVVFGFCINAVSGILLFIAEPIKMLGMPAFIGKLLLIACGMTVAWLLQKRVFADQAAMDADRVPAGGRRLAWASLTFWYLALIVGRLTGYPELVKSYFGI